MKHYLYRFICELFKRVDLGVLSKIQAVSKLQDRILSYEIKHAPGLEEFQRFDTLEILRVLYKYFKNPHLITVLDVGCSAYVTKAIAGHVKKIIGINIDELYFEVDSIPKNMELLLMDGAKMTFPDKTFDFVVSANLYEHINDLSKCIDEELRVLKNDGFCYARWEPIWSSKRGHHIHDDIVENFEKQNNINHSIYSNDGRFIDDWSHLLLTKEQMREKLSLLLENDMLIEFIVDCIYNSNMINRKFFDEIKEIFNKKEIHIVFWERGMDEVPVELLKQLRDRYSFNDFSTRKSQILFTNKEEKDRICLEIRS